MARSSLLAALVSAAAAAMLLLSAASVTSTFVGAPTSSASAQREADVAMRLFDPNWTPDTVTKGKGWEKFDSRATPGGLPWTPKAPTDPNGALFGIAVFFVVAVVLVNGLKGA
eukprot:TRINITY_DN526_c0_g1_i3.p1 TRINITY_DN526_c0_g1~~TRINITY_DN526_c0_g1_i3.p1  ORF type:complete len:113 (+),score=21.40 TRINITY_DN526_c0_g1_i3:75-413(+)